MPDTHKVLYPETLYGSELTTGNAYNAKSDKHSSLYVYETLAQLVLSNPTTPDSDILPLEFVLDLLPRNVYVHAMNFYTHKMKFGLSGIIVLIVYSISLLLTPWFHLHPGEHHSDTTGNVYHSHGESFAAHTSGHEKGDHQKGNYNHHFSETITAFDYMTGIARPNPGNFVNPTKFSTILVLFGQSFTESYSQQISRQDAFDLLLLQPQQDYCILSATNLSPPLA